MNLAFGLLESPATEGHVSEKGLVFLKVGQIRYPEVHRASNFSLIS
jgi:hypothetical protein